jgi:DNA-binding IclR family transcriptional regulator
VTETAAKRSEPAPVKAGRAQRSTDEGLKSLVKVVAVLDCFSTSNRALSLAEICTRTGYPRSTTHRLLASMREVGFVEQDRERDRYRLGVRLFEFGNIYLANLDLNREARGIIESLKRLTDQAIHLAVFDGIRAVVINRAEAQSDSGLALTVIENAPAHCTSVGKAILAFQPHEVLERLAAVGFTRYTEQTLVDVAALEADLALTRQRGYAIDDGEHQPGLRCVGAPIRNQHGKVFAAVSVSGPALQIRPEDVPGLASIVTYHANLISKRIGYQG